MELKELINANFKSLDSSESNCYFDKDRVYKIFKSNIDIESRLQVIKKFLIIIFKDAHNYMNLYMIVTEL